MLTVYFANSFKRDYKVCQKRNKKMDELHIVMKMLEDEIPLEKRHREHKLIGNYAGLWECHIEPDWLLVYDRDDSDLTFVRTGTHSDLFR